MKNSKKSLDNQPKSLENALHRRKHQRRPLEAQIEVGETQSEGELIFDSQDISEGGVFLVSDLLLEKDSDGILDQADKCPDQPETINGHQDEDGCPDKGKVIVVVKKEKIEILQKVHFATGKATILKKSFNLLDQVALTLKANPQIKNIRVDGHTDSMGREEYNRKLSQARAEAVLEYLTNKGVEANRMQAKGFGESNPIDSNKTARGREKNRRVEFTIVEDPKPNDTEIQF